MNDAILVLNAGSSSIKFSAFAERRDGLTPVAGGQMAAIHTEPKFVARDATQATFENDIYVARIQNGALETPRLLATTWNHPGAAFYWEP